MDEKENECTLKCAIYKTIDKIGQVSDRTKSSEQHLRNVERKLVSAYAMFSLWIAFSSLVSTSCSKASARGFTVANDLSMKASSVVYYEY